jgi:hypothetical protein
LCTSSCTLKGIKPVENDTNSVDSAPKCSFVDPPSIQKGEILPFRWDLEDDSETIRSDKSCTAENVGKIRFDDSFICHFKVSTPTSKDYFYTMPCSQQTMN